MERQGEDTDELGRFEDTHAVATAGVDDDLSRPEGADLGQAADQARQRLVRDGDEHEVDVGDDLRDVADSGTGKQVGGAGAGLLADRGERRHGVARPVERGAEHGPDPACADDPHAEPRRAVLAGGGVECAHVARTYSREDEGVTEPVAWRSAWQSALYGPQGSAAASPDRSVTSPPQRAGATAGRSPGRCWRWRTGSDLEGVVGIGAGPSGELLRHLYAAAPTRPLVGLDVVPRPAGLPAEVGWLGSPAKADLPAAWQPDRSLVVAHEWLDVVPCTVAEVGPDRHPPRGPRRPRPGYVL